MKSYLGLVSEYAKVHKKKNRLTVICIAISVMLVTAIFGMADMSINAQINAYIQLQGNYHATIKGITDDVAQQIDNRDDIKVSDWVGVAEDTVYEGKKLVVQGSGQAFAEQMNLIVREGRFPTNAHEALLDKKALQQWDISIGDTIEVPFADGSARAYRITGVYGEFSMLKAEDSHGLFLTVDGVRAIQSKEYLELYYVQFKKGVDIRNALAEIKADYNLDAEQISENIRLLGLMGQSGDTAILQLYLTAAILFILVTMAGVFMIAGSFNMSIMERTQFFGLLRCLGASKRQIRRYIFLEGLQYSVRGIPPGLIAGCLIMWIAVFILNILDLRFVLPEMPLFQISLSGIGAGAFMGFLVVMIASRAPAKKASQISPQAAVTGNISSTKFPYTNRKQKAIRHQNTISARLPVELSMGIHHALSSKKNLLLTSGSFALSIILFLSFTVLITFMKYAVNPLKPYAPDISLVAANETAVIEHSVLDELRFLPHIKNLYSRMFCDDIPADTNGQKGCATLISYDQTQFNWAKEMLIAGSLSEVQNGSGILVGYDEMKESNWKIGDTIILEINDTPHELKISGMLSDIPFDAETSEWILVCSESTFTELTGMNDYTIIDMQVSKDISGQVSDLIPKDVRLLDKQKRNQETLTAYYTMAVFIYGFIFVIALVALINIINTVNAGISSRIAHYGVMRAVGMSVRQMKKVVFTEALTYTVTGSITGGISGLLLHRFFFQMMITSNWGTTWEPPLSVLTAVIFVTVITTFIAVMAPTKRIEKTSIINAINAG